MTGDWTPTTGRALYRWAVEREDATGLGVVRYLRRWGKLRGYPASMVAWDAGQVAAGHAEAMRAIGEFLR
jgi:hypothetical protein